MNHSPIDTLQEIGNVVNKITNFLIKINKNVRISVDFNLLFYYDLQIPQGKRKYTY